MISSQLRDCSSVTNLKRTVSIFHHQSSSASMCWTGEHVRLDELTCICMIMFCFSWFLVLFWIYKFISIGRNYFLILIQYIGWNYFGSFVAGKRQCSSDQAVKKSTDDEYDEISLDLCRLKVNQFLHWIAFSIYIWFTGDWTSPGDSGVRGSWCLYERYLVQSWYNSIQSGT